MARKRLRYGHRQVRQVISSGFLNRESEVRILPGPHPRLVGLWFNSAFRLFVLAIMLIGRREAEIKTRRVCENKVEVSMADKLHIELGGGLVSALLRLAQELGRDPNEIVEEALLLYLGELGVGYGPKVGRLFHEVSIEPGGKSGKGDDFLSGLFERIDRGQRERGVEPLSDEEAMLLANEELHAMRREGGAGRGQGVER
jgi:hypothetical protein